MLDVCVANRASSAFPARRSSDLIDRCELIRLSDQRTAGVQQVHKLAAIFCGPFRRIPVHAEQNAIIRTLDLLPQRAQFTPCPGGDRKSTRLNSSHVKKSYAVFCM